MDAVVMTPEEFKQAMLDIAAGGDPEVAQASAQGLVCDLLTDLGYGDGIAIFQSMENWYDLTPSELGDPDAEGL